MKKKLTILYLIYFFICVGIAIGISRGNTESYQTDKYGISTDDAVALNSDTEFVSEFQLDHDNLCGITVKFQSDYQFTNEKLRLSLFDSETGELLGEDLVDLCYERIQNKDTGSTIYFSIPLKQAKDKLVQMKLVLEGEEIAVFPSLVLSETEVNHSELFINGTKSDQTLVFSVRYSMGITSNIVEAWITALFRCAIGGVLFLFFYVYADVIKARYKKRGALIQRQTCKKRTARSYKKSSIVECLVLLGSISFLLVYIYQYSIEKKIEKQKIEEITSKESCSDFVVLDQDADVLEYVFTCTGNKLSGILLHGMVEEENDEASAVKIELTDKTTGQLLVKSTVKISELSLEKEEFSLEISLEDTLRKSKEHVLEITIEAIGFEDTMVKIPAANQDHLSEMVLTVNGQQENQSIALSVEYGDVSFLKTLYLIFAGMVLLLSLVLYYTILIKCCKIEHVFVLCGLGLGIMYSLVIGINTVPDEPSHIDTVYSISNEILGIGESKKPGYLYKRADDVDMYAEEKQSLNVYSYEYLYNHLFDSLEDETLVECSGRNNLENAGKIYYLPQVLGITLGRLLSMGNMSMLMLGRLFALVFYVFITYFALRRLPFGKTTLFLVAILPISLQQAASFSYDAMINAVAFLYISYCLHMIYSDLECEPKDFIIVLITGSMIASVKGGVYFALCLLPVLLFSRTKARDRKKTFTAIGMFGVFLIAFMKTNLIRIIKNLLAVQGTVTGGAASTEVYTFSYFLEYPHRFIGMFINTIYKQGDDYLRNLLGGNLAWREVNISWMLIFAFLLVLLISCIQTEKSGMIKIREKVWMGFIAFGCYFCIEVSMLLVWTPTSYSYITGVQGRYFIPFFLLVLFLLRNSFFSIKKNIEKYLLFSAGMLNIFTLMQVVQRVME